MIEHIHIEQLSVQAYIGVTAAERKKPQTISLSITLWPVSGRCPDELKDTVDYAVVAETVTSLVTRSKHKLIEKLAGTIAADLLENFRVKRVAVEIRKFVLPDAAYVSVIAVAPAL